MKALIFVGAAADSPTDSSHLLKLFYFSLIT